MNRASRLGLRLHQGLSFSPLLRRIPRAEALFWPGCALLNLDGQLLQRCLDILRREEPELCLAAACCGQPSRYLFPRQHEKRLRRLKNLLQKQGVRRIYTACPNCSLELEKLGGVEVRPIWPVLARQLKPEDLAPLPGAGPYVWHDPCPTRRSPEQQEAVRQLLALRGCSWQEAAHSGCQARCCGNFRMLHVLRPETSAQLRQQRLGDFPPDDVILSSCQGCLGAFRGEGRETLHLLELLFGPSLGQGWSRRIRTTFNIH